MYETKYGHIRGLETEKAVQRLELLKYVKRRGVFLELFAGKGFLSRLYAENAKDKIEKLILVDKNEKYLREAEKRLSKTSVQFEIYCKDNLQFIKEDLPKLKNIVFVDFDAFGSPAEQIKKFFEHYKPEDCLVVAVTDGIGLHLDWKLPNWQEYRRAISMYFLLSGIRWRRDYAAIYLDALIDQVSVKNDLVWCKINQVIRKKHNFPIYAGYLVCPRQTETRSA